MKKILSLALVLVMVLGLAACGSNGSTASTTAAATDAAAETTAAAGNLYIRNQTLYVHLTSAALRQELMMGRELLVRTLNQRVGATVITNIIFR